jgi:hypothetical protein
MPAVPSSQCQPVASVDAPGVDVLFLFADLKYEWSLTDMGKTLDVGQSRSFFLDVGVRL